MRRKRAVYKLLENMSDQFNIMKNEIGNNKLSPEMIMKKIERQVEQLEQVITYINSEEDRP